MRRACLALALAALASCDTLASGRKYTLAKVDRDLRLVEPHRVLEDEGESDLLDRVNPTGFLGITLSGGFLPYLESVNRPEVVIFMRAKIRPQDQTQETLVWERIYLNSELESQHMVLNKDTYLPRDDIVLMPPILYGGEDVFVELRIVEVDSSDNAQAVQLINAASTTVAAFRPETAVAASVFQTVLTFLTKFNADDIEFQYDFALSTSGGPVSYERDGETHAFDLVLQPRVAKYVVVKTEHPDRTELPSRYIDVASSGIRYVLAEVLRWGTLGILEWPFWHGDRPEMSSDAYAWLMGHPFRIDDEAIREPVFDPGDGTLRSGTWEDTWFEIRGNRLDQVWRDRDGALRSQPFSEQAYLVISVVPAENGVDVEALRAQVGQERAIEALGLSTGQQSTEAFRMKVEAVAGALQSFAVERKIRQEFTTALAGARTPDEVARIRAATERRIEALEAGTSDPSVRAGLERAKSFVGDLAGKKSARITAVELHWSRDPAGGDVSLAVTTSGASTAPSLFRRRTGDAAWEPVDGGTTVTTPLGTFRQVAPLATETGSWELLVVDGEEADASSARRVPFWVGPDPAFRSASLVGLDGALVPVLGADWPAGAALRLDLGGVPADAVREIRVTDARGDERAFALGEADGRPVVVNDTGAPIEGLRRLRMVLVSRDFFAGVADGTLLLE